MSKNTIEDAKALAALKGGKCLSVEYKNNISKLEWECSSGHLWKSTYSSMRKNWCKICSLYKKNQNTIKQINKFCSTHKIICLDIEKYKKRTQTLKWKCEKGHKWNSPWAAARLSKGCPKCNIFWTIEDAYKLAQAKGGKCLSNLYERSDKKLLWECKEKHIFSSNINRINQGGWCSQCNVEKQRHGIEFAQNLALKNNGTCLSTVYKNANTRLEWICEFGHNWKATTSKIIQGRWCPTCSIGKSQRTLGKIIKEIFPDKRMKNNVRSIEWLKNPNTKMFLECDIVLYNKDDTIFCIVEYDGRQHYEPVRKFGGLKGYKETQERDKIKNYLLMKNKDKYKYFLRIPYTEALTLENIITKFDKQTGDASNYYNLEEE